MDITNKKIVFDTNIWLKLFSQSNLSKNVDENYFLKLKSENQFAIFNISLIECLMRFKRQNNIKAIRNSINYINENKIIIGNIQCSNFCVDIENIYELNSKTNEDIFLEIDELARKRFECKSTIITLWIACICELLFVAFVDTDERRDEVINFCNKETLNIKEELIKYFIQNESLTKSSNKNLLKIVNKIFINLLDKFSERFEYNNDFLEFKKKFKKIDDKNNSISYIYKGVFKSNIMFVYQHRINRTLERFYPSKLFKQIFYIRLEAFMQGEPLQKNDVEDMIMLSMLEYDKDIIIVTQDNKMRNFLKDNNYEIGNTICDFLLKI